MSTALVRQALEFVDPDDSTDDRKKRRSRPQRSSGQDLKLPKHKPKTKSKNKKLKEDSHTKDVISKLLELSKPTVDSSVTEKIVERAIKRKPLADKELKQEEGKSILFPDEDFKTFEEELFCS